MMTWKWSAFLLILGHVTGVTAATVNNSEIIGIVVAGASGMVLLSIIVAIVVLYLKWPKWYDQWMKRKGKVPMPRSYFRKKEEAKRRLISGSQNSHTTISNGYLAAVQPHPAEDRGPSSTRALSNGSVPNGGPGHEVVPSHRNERLPSYRNPQPETPPMGKRLQPSKVVQSWHQRNPAFMNRVYEEKDATLELGEELDEEFKIETEVVDNEVLDVGPFKHDHSQEVPTQGGVYPDPYLYTSLDASKRGVNTSARNSAALQDHVNTPAADYSSNGGVTTFDKGTLYL